MKMFIVIRTSFKAIHRWEDCPHEQVAYLKLPHRHVFYVEMKWEVYHDNRDKEFIMMKTAVDKFLDKNWNGKFLNNMSCEMMCRKLIGEFDAVFVSVFEDGENGSEIFA